MRETRHNQDQVGSLFREHYAPLLANLLREFGQNQFQLAEDALQDAFHAACSQWPYGGRPAEPIAWLRQVARNKAIDRLRKSGTNLFGGNPALPEHAAPPPDTTLRDRASMILLCCNPNLPEKVQIALTLKAVGGFSIQEIAFLLAMEPEAAKKMLTRAKQVLSKLDGVFQDLDSNRIESHFDRVLSVLYGFFTVGFQAVDDPQKSRHICKDALQLTHLFAESRCCPDNESPSLHALLALMCFHAARLPARFDPSGNLLSLEEQNRSQWDPTLIQYGFRALAESQKGTQLTRYHFEARIAAEHAISSSVSHTNWSKIVDQYHTLTALFPLPTLKLNAMVAMAFAGKAEEAWLAFQKFETAQPDSFLAASVEATLQEKRGHLHLAKNAWEKAASLTQSPSEKAFIQRKVEQLI